MTHETHDHLHLCCYLIQPQGLAQPKEIKVTVDGMDIELVRIEPGTRFKVSNVRTLWTVYELPVPIDAAPAFSEYIKSADHQELLQSAQWGIVDDCAQILQITFTLPDGRSYTYSR